jgi:hypothetical protein
VDKDTLGAKYSLYSSYGSGENLLNSIMESRFFVNNQIILLSVRNARRAG